MEGEMFSNREMSILSKLRGWKDSGQLCDLDLILGQSTVRAHACVLAAAIPAVQEQILRVSSSNHYAARRFSIQMNHLGERVEIFQSIVDHVYGGALRLTDENVADVMYVSQVLKYGRATEECLQYMSKNVSVTTAFDWYRVLLKAFDHANATVQVLTEFMKSNFSEILKSPGLISLQRMNVCVNLSPGMRSVSEEDKRAMLQSVYDKFVFSDSLSSSTFERAIMLYANESLSLDWNPKPLTIPGGEGMESPIRSNLFLKAKCNDSLMHKCGPARQLVLDGLNSSNKPAIVAESIQRASAIALLLNGSKLFTLNVAFEHPALRTKPSPSPTTGIIMDSDIGLSFLPSMKDARSTFGCAVTTDGIIVYGGYNRDGCLSSVELFSDSDGWTTLAPMVDKRGRIDGVAFAGVAYAFGGSTGSRILDTWEFVATTGGASKQLSSTNYLISPQSEFATVSTEDEIFILGGCQKSTVSSSTLVFDPNHQEWSGRSAMPCPRSDFPAAQVGDHIYALGGANYQSCLSSVDKYSISDDSWMSSAPMLTPRRGSAAVAHDGCIYVFGGYDGAIIQKSVEIYSLDTNTWSEGAPMNMPRCGAQAVVYRDLIYVVGGYCNWGFLSSMDCYQPNTGTWTSFI